MDNNTNITLRDNIVTSAEVLQILGISRARLSQLVQKQKLKPIKKSIFLLDDVLLRKKEQEALRKKFYRPKRKK
ncbi:hypothetical protein [Dethiobacter alkaliphilus]|uniref:hypothetical protein n=1 Tax=Dethiobacter alkaliphilus TaxID=427926 RepID=UPI00222790E7|nr:hypothetical protein [Dethiobacter alkaliphilus]MCW3491341.1 hypothetical protein [Dethiobacter alkaliphilus]